MKTLPALRWLICPFVLLSLASCGRSATKPTTQIVARPIVIDMPVVAYRSLPEALTTPLMKPPAPPAMCVLGEQSFVCALDGLALIPAYDALLDMCNADRARAALLGRTDGQ